MLDIAVQFGQSLDQDDYETTKGLLSEDCIYDTGNMILKGTEEITASYEDNMLAGRKKMDRLEWGQSAIDKISETEFVVNFTDYLYHKGEKYTHRCQQKLCLDQDGKICRIEHIPNKEEQQRLNNWYQSVGIPVSG